MRWVGFTPLLSGGNRTFQCSINLFAFGTENQTKVLQAAGVANAETVVALHDFGLDVATLRNFALKSTERFAVIAAGLLQRWKDGLRLHRRNHIRNVLTGNENTLVGHWVYPRFAGVHSLSYEHIIPHNMEVSSGKRQGVKYIIPLIFIESISFYPSSIFFIFFYKCFRNF